MSIQSMVGAAIVLLFSTTLGMAQEKLDQEKLDQVNKVEVQPLLVQVKRLQETMQYLGEPFGKETNRLIQKAREADSNAEVRELIQQALDSYCIAGININPESRVKVSPGPAARILHQNG